MGLWSHETNIVILMMSSVLMSSVLAFRKKAGCEWGCDWRELRMIANSCEFANWDLVWSPGANSSSSGASVQNFACGTCPLRSGVRKLRIQIDCELVRIAKYQHWMSLTWI